MSKRIFSPLLFSFLFAANLLAQPGTTSEADVQLQEVFIDGKQQMLLSNWEKAAAKFKEVLEKDPRNAAAAYELARVYEASKKPDEALASAKKAVELEPGNAWFQMFLAELFQRAGKDRDAAGVYEVLVKNDPRNEEYYSKWAYYLVRAGEPQKAVEIYDRLEKLTGINDETTRHKHLLYMGLGDYKKAAKEIESLIAAFPKNTAHRHVLATFYEQINDPAKAKEVYRQILALDPHDARAAIALAEDAKGNDDQQFLTSLKPVFENPNTSIDTKIKEIMPYVNRLAETGDQTLAASLLALTGILERVHPGSAKAYSVLGDVLFYTGDKEQALAKYQKALELEDNIWLVWEQVLSLLAERKDHDQLIATAEKSLDIFPNQAMAFYFLGKGLNGKGKYKDALDALQQALIMSSRNPRLRYEVLNETGLAYFHLKQYPQSDNAFEEALKIAADEPLALINYSHVLAARNEKMDKAMELATRLNERKPNVPQHEAALAFVLYKMKDFKAAKDLLARALAHGGESDPAILEQFGDVSFQLGNAGEAVQYWQKAIEKGGKSEALQKKIADGKL